MTISSPVSPSSGWTFRRVVWATLVFAFVFMCFWLVYRFYEVIFTLFIAIVIGTVLRPIANWLYLRGVPRMVGMILVYLVFLTLIAGFLWLLFPVLFAQGANIAREIPAYYQSLRTSLAHSPNPFIVRLGGLFPPAPLGFTPPPPTDQTVVDSAGQLILYVRGAAHAIFIAIVILILTLYWALDGPRIIKSMLLLVPQDRRESMSELIAAMEAKVGFYIAGQGLLCLFIGVLALIAYILIGLPNALVLAMAAGVLEAVPMVGPILGAVPSSLVAFSIAPVKVVWVIVATTIIQQTENVLLVPRVMKSTVGVNPFVTLVSLFAFSSLFGIPGALMAIPMAAIVQLALNHFVFKPAAVELDASEGRDYASRLRYEAQDLIQDLRKQARLRKKGSDEKVVQVERVMDEIESLTTNLDALLAQSNSLEEE